MASIFSCDHVANRLDEFLQEAALSSRARREIESMREGIRLLMLLFKNAVSKLLKSNSNRPDKHEELVDQFIDALDELENLMDDYLVNRAKMAAAAAASARARPGVKQTKLLKGFLESRRLANEIAGKREGFWKLIDLNFKWESVGEDLNDRFHDKISNDLSIVLKPRFSAKNDPTSISSSEWAKRLHLLLINPDLQRRAIISIVGPNSQGKKTDLVKQVYNDPTIIRSFSYRCWVDVRSKENTLNLLKTISKILLNSSSNAIENDEQKLKTEISNHLSKGRYLIVIDGALDREAWSSIEDAFPRGKGIIFPARGKGSRFLNFETKGSRFLKFEPKGSRVVVVADEFEDPDIPISRFSGTRNFIGFNEWAETLIKYIVDAEKMRAIISVIGPSGIGKTTLTQHVYDDARIIESFQIRCWVAAQYKEDRLDLLKRILKGLTGLSDVVMVGMKEQQLKTKITNSLKGKKYLMVIGGASLGTKTWSSIKSALPDENHGSRVVIVADEFEDQDSVSQNSPRKRKDSISLRLEYLNEQQNWDLFCREAFLNGECPPDLLKFKNQIFKLCGGLPLATVLLAGVLRGKECKYSVWSKVLSSNYGKKRKKQEQEQEQEQNEENDDSIREMEGENQEQEEENSNSNRETEGGGGE